MTEACVHMKCYSLKRVPSEWNTRMKAQRINDNHLSNDREATSRLPALALILPARTTAAHMKHKCTLTRSSLALDLVADVCGYNYAEPWISLSTRQGDKRWAPVCAFLLSRGEKMNQSRKRRLGPGNYALWACTSSSWTSLKWWGYAHSLDHFMWSGCRSRLKVAFTTTVEMDNFALGDKQPLDVAAMFIQMPAH